MVVVGGGLNQYHAVEQFTFQPFEGFAYLLPNGKRLIMFALVSVCDEVEAHHTFATLVLAASIPRSVAYNPLGEDGIL